MMLSNEGSTTHRPRCARPRSESPRPGQRTLGSLEMQELVPRDWLADFESTAMAQQHKVCGSTPQMVDAACAKPSTTKRLSLRALRSRPRSAPHTRKQGEPQRGQFDHIMEGNLSKLSVDLLRVMSSASGNFPKEQEELPRSPDQRVRPSSAPARRQEAVVRQPTASDKFMKERRRKLKAESDAVESKFEQSKGDATRRFLSRIREANDWSKPLGMSTRFVPEVGAGGVPICHIYEDGHFTRSVSQRIFDKRHAVLRKRMELSSSSHALLRLSNSTTLVTARPLDSTQCVRCLATAPRMNEDEEAAMQAKIRCVTLETLALAANLRAQLQVIQDKPKHQSPFVIH